MSRIETTSSKDAVATPDAATSKWLALVSVALAALAITTIVLAVQVHRLRGEVAAMSARDTSAPGPVTTAESPEICRTLGALAARERVPLDRIFTAQVLSACEQQARQGAAAVSAQ